MWYLVDRDIYNIANISQRKIIFVRIKPTSNTDEGSDLKV